MSIALRLLARTELGSVARLHADCFPTDAWEVRDFLELLAIRGASGHVAIGAEGRIVGFILDMVGVEDAEILTIGTAPGERRRGIGRTLIADLARRARLKGAARILLEVAADNHAAIRLYESNGFTLLGERPGYYRRPTGRTDAYMLGLSLSRSLDHA